MVRKAAPQLKDFQDWFRWKLGGREQFVGEYGAMQAYENRLPNTALPSLRESLLRELSKVKYRIKLMESLIEKGWVYRRDETRQELNAHETALFNYLRMLFLVQWHCGEWGSSRYTYVVNFVKYKSRIEHYESSKYPSHDEQCREAYKRCQQQNNTISQL